LGESGEANFPAGEVFLQVLDAGSGREAVDAIAITTDGRWTPPFFDLRTGPSSPALCQSVEGFLALSLPDWQSRGRKPVQIPLKSVSTFA
jgi:hypothetical protein